MLSLAVTCGSLGAGNNRGTVITGVDHPIDSNLAELSNSRRGSKVIGQQHLAVPQERVEHTFVTWEAFYNFSFLLRWIGSKLIGIHAGASEYEAVPLICD